jgi:hypothetical protein
MKDRMPSLNISNYFKSPMYRSIDIIALNYLLHSGLHKVKFSIYKGYLLRFVFLGYNSQEIAFILH